MSYDPPKPPTGVVIYGASDDLIEVNGQIRDEFTTYHRVHQQVPITASDGTQAAAWFDPDGIWRFIITQPGGGNPTVAVHTWHHETSDGRYTDLLYVQGDVAWVTVGEPVPLTDAMEAHAATDWDAHRSNLAGQETNP